LQPCASRNAGLHRAIGVCPETGGHASFVGRFRPRVNLAMSGRSGFLALTFSSVGHYFAHLLTLLYPTVVLALDGQFDLTFGQLLSLSTPGFILFGAGALPAGWLGDRWNAERMMVLFFLGTGAAAVATGLASGPWGLAIGLSFIGLCGSIYHPVGVAWLVRNAENRGRALGWNGIFGSLGVGTAAIVAGALTQWFGWRAAFIVPGALCLLTGLALLLCVRSGSVTAAKQDRRVQPASSRDEAIRAFFVLSVTMLCTGLVGQVLMVALPKVFTERLPALTQGGLLGAGGFVTLVFLASAAVQLVGGRLADRYPQKPLYIVFWAAQMPLFLAATTLVEAPLVLAMMAVAMLGTMGATAENVILARFTPGKWRATAFGAKFVLSLGVAAGGVPLVGWLYDTTGGFYDLFLVLAAICAVTAAAALLLPGRPRPITAIAPQPAE
jgi:FSR family fosmidomycin resistance protein-like MFS transporter